MNSRERIQLQSGASSLADQSPAVMEALSGRCTGALPGTQAERGFASGNVFRFLSSAHQLEQYGALLRQKAIIELATSDMSELHH
jgi:hypothetical protein